ncbi:hypothetical protein C0989_000769 [Termitomyces sp. Mn162]|nr:hypothetical protein C0989_000769 [Termitomyces sp. Mn162]
MSMAGQQQPATMSSQVRISVLAVLTADAMEVDNDGPESITAQMKLLAPPCWSYLLLPTGTCLLDASSTLSSMLGQSIVASTSKGKGEATAMSPPTSAQEGSTPLSTAWKMVEQCFSTKKKGKSKAKEPEPSTAADEQIAHLLQWLHEGRVPEDRNEAPADLFCSVLEKGKQIATPPNPLEAKKACTEPSVFVKGSLIQRALLMPYDDIVLAGND